MGRPKKCRGSGGKRKFKTHEAALQRCGEIMVEDPKARLSAYLCRFCGHYHLTSKEHEH